MDPYLCMTGSPIPNWNFMERSLAISEDIVANGEGEIHGFVMDDNYENPWNEI